MHQEVIELLTKYPNSYRHYQFDKELTYISTEIRAKYRDSKQFHEIRKSIKGTIKQMHSISKDCLDANKVNGNLFFQKYFGGMPLDSKSLVDAPYDLVVETEHNQVTAWIFCSNTPDEQEIKSHVEQDFRKDCNQILVKFELEDQESEIEEPEKELTPVEIPEQESNKQSDISKDFEGDSFSADANDSEPTWMGKVIFDKAHQFVRKSTNNDQMYGYIFEQFLDSVHPLDVLTFESRKDNIQILARIEEMRTNNFSGGGFGQSFHVLGTICRFKPILEIENGQTNEQCQQRDLSDFAIRKPNPVEYNVISGLPTSGLPVGKISNNEYEIDAYFPYDPNTRNLDSSIYQSFFITGVMGYGKTNFIKLLEQVMTGNSKIPKERRPAVVNLDGEFGFSYFPKREHLEEKTRAFLDQHEIEDVDPKILTIAKDLTGDATLSLEALSPEAFLYMMPELDPKTEGIALQILQMAYHVIQQQGMERTFHNVRRESLNLISGNSLVHPLQRPALNRAFFSIELDLFDQENKKKILPETLFQPGTITTVNVNGLDKNRRRIVALYLLELANHFKVENNNPEPGVIITIDECEQITPSTPTKREKVFVERCVERMETITELGRKRFYGLIAVSHDPSAVSRRIANLANTKIVFRSSGSDAWISREFGREYVPEARLLPIGASLWRINIAGLNSKNPVSKIQTLNMDDVRSLDNSKLENYSQN
jgi:hypothetical protein